MRYAASTRSHGGFQVRYQVGNRREMEDFISTDCPTARIQTSSMNILILILVQAQKSKKLGVPSIPL